MGRFDQILPRVNAPGRYLPLEMGAKRADLASARVRVALAFPDVYEVGMSHLGVQILYHLLNRLPGVACDRAYAPYPDMEALLREQGIALVSHEAGAPLKSFDVLGFSLTYELCYPTVLNMLDLAGIPALASERESGWPLVIGGGPCAGNPEPVAPFFDAILFGDGEEAVPEMIAAVGAWKERGGTKAQLLTALAQIEGVYVPAHFTPSYLPDGRVEAIAATGPAAKVVRRVVADLDAAFFPARPLTPVLEPVHDRVMLEIMRGCGRGCRFCQAGVLYRPVRERGPATVLGLAAEALAATGYEECSLLALSAGDYSRLSELLVALIHDHYRDRVSVSLPSLRVQGLPDAVLQAIESVRKTGFTLAPEAGTERLRRVINKAYTEQDLIDTATRVFGAGWRNLKLYFMIGLPTETDEDLAGIVRLVRRVGTIRGEHGRPQVSVALSGFVPKAHTPFQWEVQEGPARLREIQERIRRDFGPRGPRVKWQDPAMSRLEGVLARGDRRLAPVIQGAHARGARLDGWGEHFDPARWDEALAAAGLDPDFYTRRERAEDEVLPWDHLDARVSRSWLRAERDRARREEPTPDCRETGCVNPCGVCDQETIKVREASGSGPAPRLALERSVQPEVFFRFRVRYARRDAMRFMGQLDGNRMINRLVRRAGLPMRYSQGFHPQPRIMFGPSPPLGVASEAEYADVELIARRGPEAIHAALQAAAPEGIVILEVREVPVSAPAVSAAITGFEYTIRPPAGLAFDPEAVARFLALDRLEMTQKREKGDREVDVRARVRGILLGPEGELRLSLRVLEGPGVKPQEVVQAVFGWDEAALLGLAIVRTEARIKEARPVRYSGRAERVRRPGGVRSRE
jgi:radical SAM family uncharacterized protein/radical SAM-linked protein